MDRTVIDLPELFPIGMTTEEISVMAFLSGHQGRVTVAGVTAYASPEDDGFDVGMRSLLSKGLVHVAEGVTSVARLVTDVSRCLAAPDATGLLLFALDGDGEAFVFASAGDDLFLLLQHVSDGVLSCWIGPTQLEAVAMAIGGRLSGDGGHVAVRIDPLVGDAVELGCTNGQWHESRDTQVHLGDGEVRTRIARVRGTADRPVATMGTQPGEKGDRL